SKTGSAAGSNWSLQKWRAKGSRDVFARAVNLATAVRGHRLVSVEGVPRFLRALCAVASWGSFVLGGVRREGRDACSCFAAAGWPFAFVGCAGAVGVGGGCGSGRPGSVPSVESVAGGVGYP